MKIVTAFAVGLVLAGALSAAPAHAQNARSFVSGHGNDNYNCGLATPCRTFAAALLVTNSGGEIDVLDPAGYGAMTINKAVSIVNDGVGTASILVPSTGTGIIINAQPGDAVHLRGLTIEGAGSGLTGIQFNTGKSMAILNTVIRHVTGDGIDFLPGAASTLEASNTYISDNSGVGIYVQGAAGSGTVTAIFNRVAVYNGGGSAFYVNGGSSTGTVNVTAMDSVAGANSSSTGFLAEGFGAAAVHFKLVRSAAISNGTGLFAEGANATILIDQSTLTENGTSWTINGGVIQSYGDNDIDGGANGLGSLTPVTKQ